MSTASRYLYVRLLRHADHAVFGVQSGQKKYWHPLFSTQLPFSSGQQVKRSVLEALTDRLNEDFAPVRITQVFKRSGSNTSLGDGEPLSAADPAFADQLIGGWMRAQKQDRSRSKRQANEESEAGSDRTRVYRRRSPLSISALHPLHPLLATLNSEALTFDRTGVRGDHSVIVRDENGVEMMVNDEASGKMVPNKTLQDWLDGRGESLKLRTFMPEGKVGPRATGLFIVDMAIDLDRLYTVSVDPYDPEINPETEKLLLEKHHWTKEGTRLVCPKERRAKIGEALAEALVGWRITSNQARTMSLQDTLAVAISTDANLLASSIRATLNTDGEKDRAQPVVDKVDGVELFVSPALEAYISPQHLPGTDARAVSNAAAFLKDTFVS